MWPNFSHLVALYLLEESMADTVATLRQEIDTLKQAVKVPPGTLFPFAGDQAPGGFLMADGKTLDPGRPEFAALCAIIGDRFNLPGDPVGTYRLPDLRGRILLGAGGTGSAVTRMTPTCTFAASEPGCG
jgi:hypothetical protein